MSRLDQRLVELKLVSTRSKAQQLIRKGSVEVRKSGTWSAIKNVSYKTVALAGEDIRVTQPLRYVSRGGVKLEGALVDFNMDINGARVLDIGLSTGGFADCLLQHGATEVVGIDVGRDQVAASLKVNSRLRIFENLHVQDIGQVLAGESQFDFLVMDVSFISCLKALPPALQFLKTNGVAIVLVKPQFELGAEALNKKGVVKDVGLYDTLKVTIEKEFSKLGLPVSDYRPSRLKGQNGNQEFFVLAKKF